MHDNKNETKNMNKDWDMKDAKGMQMKEGTKNTMKKTSTASRSSSTRGHTSTSGRSGR